MFIAITAMNPGYMDPMFVGWGPVVLLASAAWAALGFVVILRTVKVEV